MNDAVRNGGTARGCASRHAIRLRHEGTFGEQVRSVVRRILRLSLPPRNGCSEHYPAYSATPSKRRTREQTLEPMLPVQSSLP